MKAFNDDDHVIGIFREEGYWGAVAKSNFTSLRFREPVYRSLSELIMSYFDFFFNINGEKSLRSYSLPFICLPITTETGPQQTRTLNI